MDAVQLMNELLLAGGRTSLFDAGRLVIDGKARQHEQIIEILKPYLTDSRLQRISEVVEGRTRTVVPVIEGLANTGNVSAVMRTSEALGFQDFHVVIREKPYKHSRRTTQGAQKWLDIHVWDRSETCARALKEQGFQIIAMHLDEEAVAIDSIDFTQPVALVFGNERDGLSPEMLQLADQHCMIPISGFMQSFNISVAAGVSLYHARQDRITRQGYHGDLTEQERAQLRAVYCMLSVNSADAILRRAFE